MEAASLSLVAALISFFFSLWVFPFLIHWYKNKKVLAEDMNKADRPQVPGFGGLGIVLAFLLAVNIAIVTHVIADVGMVELALLLPALVAVVTMAFVGFVDDVLLFPIRPIKPILSLFAAIPLMAVEYHEELPVLADINGDITWLYPVLFLPLLFIFTSNAINIMADFDGLVPGNGMIISATLFIAGWLSGESTAMMLSAALFASLAVFYVYNRYPSRMFSGNIGTLFVGAVIGVIGIIGHAKIALFILLIPYAIHFLLQERIIFEKGVITARPRERGIPAEDGTLKSEYSKSYGLTHFLLIHGKKMTEKKLVHSLFAIELLCALIAIFVHMFRLGLIG